MESEAHLQSLNDAQGQPNHPYYPIDVPIPHFRQNEDQLVFVLAIFGGLVGAVVLGAWKVGGWTGSAAQRLSWWNRFCVSWFALCKSYPHFVALSPQRQSYAKLRLFPTVLWLVQAGQLLFFLAPLPSLPSSLRLM